MSNITNINLIDCNQQFSEQARNEGSNTNEALFTNQVGSIEVKAGDKISVLQSYVSKILLIQNYHIMYLMIIKY